MLARHRNHGALAVLGRGRRGLIRKGALSAAVVRVTLFPRMGAAVTLVALFSIAVAMLPASASAQQRAHRSTRPSTVLATTVSPNSPILERESESRSIGVPDRGRLRAPVELVSTPHLAAREGTRRTSYGTAELVGLITRAAAAVRVSGTGPRLVVGDLSAPAGGRLR